MKLTDFMSDIGRPVAYYPNLKKITGSTTATILLCQFIYWRGKEYDADGWLYKTAEEIEAETGLSYNEQKTARAALKEAGLIEEHYARLDHQMKFRVNLDAVNDKWGTLQPVIPESGNPSFGKDGIHRSLNESENTSENTNNTFAIKPDAVDLELSKLGPKALRDAFRDHFRLTPNWETKSARQFMQWSLDEQITPEQIKAGADIWGSDKRFNWSHPTLKSIQEQWYRLMDAVTEAQQNVIPCYED
jgi:hypothetical protein